MFKSSITHHAKSSITRMAAAAFVGAALTFGATNLRAEEPHQLTWVVINQHVYPDKTLSCRTEFHPTITADLEQYAVGPNEDPSIPNNICVTRMDLTVSGIEQLPESLGDDLVGLFPAVILGQPVEFSVYLPQISR